MPPELVLDLAMTHDLAGHYLYTVPESGLDAPTVNVDEFLDQLVLMPTLHTMCCQLSGMQAVWMVQRSPAYGGVDEPRPVTVLLQPWNQCEEFAWELEENENGVFKFHADAFNYMESFLPSEWFTYALGQLTGIDGVQFSANYRPALKRIARFSRLVQYPHTENWHSVGDYSTAQLKKFDTDTTPFRLPEGVLLTTSGQYCATTRFVPTNSIDYIDLFARLNPAIPSKLSGYGSAKMNLGAGDSIPNLSMLGAMSDGGLGGEVMEVTADHPVPCPRCEQNKYSPDLIVEKLRALV